ncbi:MAG TPA: carboxypeptidase regulatory-like domain-containing protein [Bryobacteraceae bacterium]|nr:carboxypeptidase regulatory-like domain-containing protein [Bryobacteraceae bacterium]
MRRSFLVSLVSLAFLALPSFSQVSSGSLLGDAHDEKSAAVQAVVITARNNDTGFTRTASTNEFGSYRIDDLLPGAYTVTAQHDGFQAMTVSPLFVELNQKVRLDFDLKIGSVHETATVTAHASPLQTEEASEGYTLGSNFFEELPLLGRQIVDLVTLGPGAIPRQLSGFTHDLINDVQGNRGAVAFNAPVNGARSTSNSYILDGTDNTDRNTLSIAVMPLMESISEFRIQSSLAPAEFEQNGGAVIDMVTKSGSRAFHGNVFEFFRNEFSDAAGFFAVPGLPQAIFRQNQYGGTLSGPLAKSTYFLVSFEGLRSLSSNSTQHLLPTAAVRGGDFSGGATIFNPLSLDSNGARTPFPNNTIPASMIDPTVAKYLATYEPLPNASLSNGFDYVDATPNRDNSDNGSVRVDHAWGERDRLFARYTINDERSALAGSFPALPTIENLRAQQAAIGNTLSGPSWVNETHFAFTRLRVFDLPTNAFGANVLSDLGISGLADSPLTYGLPAITVTDYETVQDSDNLPQNQRDNNWNFGNSFSRTVGRHTWKAGFDFTHFTMAYLQSLFVRGNFIFNGQYTNDPNNPNTTGDAFADFLLGYPSETQRTVGNPQAYLRQNGYAAFLQDDWRVTQRISISAGLRYEYRSPFSEDQGKLLNLDYSTLPNPPTLEHVGSVTDSNNLNFAPRLGVAIRLPHWLPGSHESVFRAGYGIYYAPSLAIEAYDLVNNNVINETNTPSGLAPFLTIQNGFPQTNSTGFPSYYGVDPHAPTTYMQQWAASIQQELPGNTLLEISYVGSKGTDLSLFRRFNTPAQVEIGADLPPRPGNIQDLRTFPQLGTLYQIQHIGKSTYHSLQIKAEKRMTRRVSFLGSFVWAKSIDDADAPIVGNFDSFGAQDERNLRLERGLSIFDVRYRVSGGFVFALPTAPVLKPAFRNWQLSGTVDLQTGQPENPVYYATDIANSGTPNRPNIVPGQSINLPSSQRNVNQEFNTNAFSTPAPFTFGNAGRDILPTPGNEVVDVSLDRRFVPVEGKTIEFRWETFNVLNHPNLGIPLPYPDFAPLFGAAVSAGNPRRMQFALRFDF